MDNIVLLAIFSYPGAVVDWVYTHLAKDKTFYTQPDSAIRAARDFFFSALIAVVTMPLVIPGSEGGHTLSNWVDVMKKSEVVWQYIIISFICAMLMGIIWYLLRKYPVSWLQKKYAAKRNAAPAGLYKTVWQEVTKTPDEVDITHCAMIIRKNGELVRAGLPYATPDSIEEDPALALMRCDMVEAEIALGKESTKILEHWCSYYDLKTGVEIELRNARPLWEEQDQEARG